MIKTQIWAALALFGILLFTACNKDDDPVNNPPSGNCPDVEPTWEGDVSVIMTRYCAGDFNPDAGEGCHNTGSPQGNFNNVDVVRSYVNDGIFQDRVLEPGADMPPDYSTGPQSLTSCERETLELWIADGMPLR